MENKGEKMIINICHKTQTKKEREAEIMRIKKKYPELREAIE